MSLKYRVIYDDYPKYQKNKAQWRIKTVILLLLFAVSILCFPYNIHEKLIEISGFTKSAINVNSRVLSEVLSKGEELVHSLDILCELIIHGR